MYITKTGLAPMSATTSTVEMNVKPVVMTSSPGPIPSAIKAICKASVPFPRESHASTHKFRQLLGKSSHFGPFNKCPRRHHAANGLFEFRLDLAC